jgi:type IX secretion system PorP/SprF family membrane protein
LIIFGKLAQSQDINFTQFYSDRLYLNPALAGYTPCNRVFVSYRNQWPSVQNVYNTYTTSYEMPVPLMHGGVGFRLMHDQQGSQFKNTNFDAVYSYHLQVTRDIRVLMGLQASVMVLSQAGGSYAFQSQINPITGTIDGRTAVPGRSTINIDFSTGVYAFAWNFFGGLSVHHLTQPKLMEAGDMVARMNMKYTLSLGAKFDLVKNKRYGYDEFSISPNIIGQMQGDNKKVNWGVYIQYGDLVFGSWVRHVHWAKVSAASILLGIDKEQWKVGYSYDFSVSKIGYLDGGAHEITASYTFGCRSGEKYRGHGTITCPSF